MSLHPSLSRRHFAALVGAAAFSFPRILRAAGRRPSLGICLYGMGRLGLDDALRACSAIGYDNVEIMIAPGYPSDPARLSAEARRGLRRRLDGLRLSTSALLLRDMILGAPVPAHRQNLETIKVGAQMAHDMYPEGPPPLESIMGGKTSDWEPNRHRLAEHLSAWAATAAAAAVRLDIKAHAGQAVDTPEKLLWLMGQVRNPALAIDFDYSHFEPAGLPLEGTLRKLLPYTKFIQVKDVHRVNGAIRYLLPGEGDVDYAAYFRLLRRVDYSGPVVVEVSKHVYTRPGFDFVAAARSSHAVLASAAAG